VGGNIYQECNLKTEHKVIVLAAMFGLLMWVIDAILDSFIFKNTFMETLITDVPHHELYMRSVVIGCFLIFSLIRKQADSELKKAHDKLEKRVKERTAELVTANEKLKQEVEERKRADERLKTSLGEKEVLLQEIHHRVKNNLQIISSLLDMSSMRIHEQQAIDLLNDARDKIHSMALIHIQLYQSEKFAQIEMGNYIRELIGYLSMLYSTGKGITTIVDVSNVYLSITQAIPCALVLSELISNAFKHAFKERQGGNIAIFMQRASDDTICIGVKDDGIGIPNEVNVYETNSLGLKLVRNLVQKQLKGTIELPGTNGTEFIIEFRTPEQHI
jgi:two-component sensor histidine kinase